MAYGAPSEVAPMHELTGTFPSQSGAALADGTVIVKVEIKSADKVKIFNFLGNFMFPAFWSLKYRTTVSRSALFCHPTE
jgi:hypothetical protein